MLYQYLFWSDSWCWFLTCQHVLCVSFLGLLEQNTTNRVAYSHRKIFSRGSEGGGLKSGYWWCQALSEASREAMYSSLPASGSSRHSPPCGGITVSPLPSHSRLPSLPIFSCGFPLCASLPLLRRIIAFIRLRAHSSPMRPHLNSMRTLFPNKGTFWGSEDEDPNVSFWWTQFNP